MIPIISSNLSQSLLHCGFACFARLDTHGVLDRPDEDFAVAAPARVGDVHDRLDYRLNNLVARDDLDASLLRVKPQCM